MTTGEWAQALRDVFGSYRAPTGVGEAASPAADEDLRDEVARVSEALGRTLKILVGKPGLDGHSNGAEQIAVRARDVGMDVVYEGIRLTPAQIARSAVDEGVHVIGLSILSGSHRELIPDGQLCGAGTTKYAAYNAARTDWPTTQVQANATMEFRYNAWAPHPGTWTQYITRDGYDPTQPLKWSDLELKAQIGNTPAARWQAGPATSG